MSPHALAGASACLVLALAAPARAETVFVGEAIFTFASPGCASAARQGDFARVIFRPLGAALGNGNDSHLVFITSRASYAMLVQADAFRANVNYAGQSINSDLTISTRVGGVTAWQQAPVGVVTSTPRIRLTASFSNFFARSGCSVSIRANLLNGG